MIIDHLRNAARYCVLHPQFERAFAWLREHAANAAEDRHELDGERLFVMVSDGQGGGRAGKVLEAHRRYIDIHYTLSGTEEIGWKATAECAQRQTAYDADNDFELFSDAPASWSTLPPGVFAVCFPEDAHAPLAGTGAVRKCVVKIAVEE